MIKKRKLNLEKSKYLVLSYLIILNILSFQSQQLLYSDIFNGGVTAGGFSSGQGTGSGSFSLYIEPGSTIKRAFLFTYRQGYAPNVPITVNNSDYLFDTTSSIMQVNHLAPHVSPITLYCYDFSDILNANLTNTFNVTIPSQPGLPIGWGYFTAFIYIAYENPSLSKVATTLWINDKNFVGNESYYCNNMNPINTNFPMGLSLFMDRSCNDSTDGNLVYVNGNNIGLIGGPDAVNINAGCAGVKGHFYYQNNTLYGLDDDTPDSIMAGTDALANITSYLVNDSSYTLTLIHNDLDNIGKPNTTPLFINAYTTLCDTFSTSLNITDTTICANQPLQLEINGLPQYTYEWHQLDSILGTDSVLNLTPEHSQLYSVWVKDTNGCMVTEMVNITVNENPTIDSIVVTPTLCADSTGTIEVVGATGGTPYFGSAYIYTLNGNNNTNISEYNNDFIHLDSGDYIIRVNDDVGCYFEDTVQLNEYIDVNASFSASVTSGEYPLAVDFNNLSNNADGYYWYLPHDTLTTTNVSTEFDTTGVYTVELIAWQNEPRCADTTIKTINVKAPFKVTVPSVFNAHTGPFSVYAYGTKEIDFTVFNSIGQLVYQASVNITDGENTIWIDQEVSQGIYHYRMTATGVNGDEQSKSGKILVIK